MFEKTVICFVFSVLAYSDMGPVPTREHGKRCAEEDNTVFGRSGATWPVVCFDFLVVYTSHEEHFYCLFG